MLYVLQSSSTYVYISRSDPEGNSPRAIDLVHGLYNPRTK